MDIRFLLGGVLLSLLSAMGAWAGTGALDSRYVESLPGLDKLPVYPNAHLIEQVTQSARNYPVLRNRVSKIRGRLRSQDDLWLNGTLFRRIYEMPAGHGSGEAFAFFDTALEQLDVDELFVCSGRDCGSSNLWANDIFQVAFLYGYESDQHYLLGQRGDGLEYFALYTITRGNRKTYALIDHLVVDREADGKIESSDSRR